MCSSCCTHGSVEPRRVVQDQLLVYIITKAQQLEAAVALQDKAQQIEAQSQSKRACFYNVLTDNSAAKARESDFAATMAGCTVIEFFLKFGRLFQIRILHRPAQVCATKVHAATILA